MPRFHASWIVPICGPPLRDAWVDIDGDRVAAVGREPRASADGRSGEVDLGQVAILPGLVNAHTHLELSYLRGRVPAAPAFVTWIRAVIEARRRHGDPAAPEILDSIDVAIAECVACGTAVVGEISNTLVTFAPLARGPLAGVVFYELIGFNPSDPTVIVERARQSIQALGNNGSVRASLAAHAPYSVAPSLFRAIRRAVDQAGSAVCSVHLAESAEEVEFIRTGEGPWTDLLKDVGAWDPEWTPPRVSPVEYLDTTEFLHERVLAVHGTRMTPADLARLARRGATLVACPRSNRYTGAGTPPIDAFYASGVRVAVGTDSLASTPDLNVFAELAEMRALAPRVPARRLLDSATRQGACALGFGADFGSIEPGRVARLLAVDLEAGIDDVEEYLVSGIEPEQVRWIS